MRRFGLTISTINLDNDRYQGKVWVFVPRLALARAFEANFNSLIALMVEPLYPKVMLVTFSKLFTDVAIGAAYGTSGPAKP